MNHPLSFGVTTNKYIPRLMWSRVVSGSPYVPGSTIRRTSKVAETNLSAPAGPLQEFTALHGGRWGAVHKPSTIKVSETNLTFGERKSIVWYE